MGFFDSIGGFASDIINGVFGAGTSSASGVADTIGSIFSPSNINTAIGAYGTASKASSAADAANKVADAKYQHDIDLANLDFEHKKELMALAGGGGGGGGSGNALGFAQLAYQKERDRKNAINAANVNAMTGAQNSSNAILEAYRNMIEAAQKPLLVR